eukprot:CAMPEP_0194444980 /NCGR_PEP_ID=MMETSP0176-20130528/127593_1 /TAXON_ID=216777 /ORGANISM="Proboscia alata, Strain PI-D3" /LENGTH=568 /DNA_ID=CAMNT_0039271459 /DNA_START=13 /DNA_END=1719 /DNA_ORIENTATION=-
MTKVSRTTRIKSGMIATILAFALSIAVIVILGNNLEKHDINDHMEEQQQHRRLANKRTTTYVDTDLNDEPISNLRSVGDYPVVATDKPFFWWAPLAGCPDASDIIKKCGLSKDVDTSTREGIQEFLDKKLASDKTVDMIVSPYFKEAAGVFNSDYQGRAFTFIRNPIKRELAHFHDLNNKNKTHEKYNSALAGMDLGGYVNSEYANNNWLTRHLLGKHGETLILKDLEAAKDILREKVLVLLVDDSDEQINSRLRMYFGSSGIASDIINKCVLSKDVDTSTREGIQEFLDKKLASDETVDMIVSPYFKEAAGVFNSDYQGRAFTFIRDPIKRELAHFHYLQKMEKTDKNYNIAVAGMALEGYVNSDYANNNWLTRHLIGKEKGVLSEENLEMAKAILREKVLVLLVDDVHEHISYRLRMYFGSSGIDMGGKWDCIDDVHEHISYRLRMYFGSSGIDMGGKWDCIGKMVHHRYESFKFPMIKKNTHEYSMLTRNNNFDIKLYHYARYLYQHQKVMIDRKGDEHEQELYRDIQQREERAAALEATTSVVGANNVEPETVDESNLSPDEET